LTSVYQLKAARKACGKTPDRSLRWLSGWTGMMLWLCVAVANAQQPKSLPIIADDLDRESLSAAIAQSLTYLSSLPSDRIVGIAPRTFYAAEVAETLRVLAGTLKLWQCRQCWINELAERFEFLPSSDNAVLQPMLVTGYYQPTIDASLTPTQDYRYPLYRMPADLVMIEDSQQGTIAGKVRRVGRYDGDRLVPYYSRAEIDRDGVLRGRGDEIAWAKDPVDIFFLQIQGSGILRLPDGRHVQIGYAGQNGLPYRSIGRLLIESNKIPRDEMSMQRLRRYLAEHPEEQDAIMAHNESYVFFRLLPRGPLGSLEVPVTPGRSIATDSRLFPRGAAALLYSERPVLDSHGNLSGWTPFLRLVLNQDTGGAIRGAQRIDLFFGAESRAESEAGFMNSPGKLFFLILKDVPSRAAVP
jgi:membrane-bound lytic murein transglycosylase A